MSLPSLKVTQRSHRGHRQILDSGGSELPEPSWRMNITCPYLALTSWCRTKLVTTGISWLHPTMEYLHWKELESLLLWWKPNNGISFVQTVQSTQDNSKRTNLSNVLWISIFMASFEAQMVFTNICFWTSQSSPRRYFIHGNINVNCFIFVQNSNTHNFQNMSGGWNQWRTLLYQPTWNMYTL